MIYKLIKKGYFPKKMEEDVIYIQGFGKNRTMFCLERPLTGNEVFLQEVNRDMEYERFEKDE